MSGSRAETWVWTGAIAAPVCWFLQQQLALYLLPLACAGRPWIPPLVSVAFAVIAIAAAALSLWGVRRVSAPGNRASFSERRAKFVGVVGTIMPLLFLIAIFWQLAASLAYSGCAA